MVAVCLEYAGGAADDVFVYFSATPNSSTADFFFGQTQRIRFAHKLVDADTSTGRQSAVLDVLMDEVRRLRAAAAEFGQPTPSEGRLHYNVATRQLDSDFHYGPLDLGPNELETDIVNRWVEAERVKLGPTATDLVVAASAGIGEQAALEALAEVIAALAGEELTTWQAAVGVSIRLDEDGMTHEVVCYDGTEGRYLRLRNYQPLYTELDQKAWVLANEQTSHWAGLKMTVIRGDGFSVEYSDDMRWAWQSWTRGDEGIPGEQLVEMLKPNTD